MNASMLIADLCPTVNDPVEILVGDELVHVFVQSADVIT